MSLHNLLPVLSIYVYYIVEDFDQGNHLLHDQVWMGLSLAIPFPYQPYEPPVVSLESLIQIG